MKISFSDLEEHIFSNFWIAVDIFLTFKAPKQTISVFNLKNYQIMYLISETLGILSFIS